MADYRITNESLGLPDYPPAPPQPPQLSFATPPPARYGPTFREVLDVTTRPTPWAYGRPGMDYGDPRRAQWEAMARQQRLQDLGMLERRLGIEERLQKMDPRMTPYQEEYLKLMRQRAQQAARERTHKPLTEGLSTQLGTLSKTLESLRTLGKSFKGREYTSTLWPTGIGSETVGSVERFARERLPFLDEGMSQWWRMYERLNALVERNEAFGATLSANEQTAWAASDIHPGLRPETISKHINTRAGIVKRQLDRLMRSTVGTYDPRQVEELAGYPIPQKAARWQDPVNLQLLENEGSALTGLKLGSERVLTPTQRQILIEELERRSRGQ